MRIVKISIDLGRVAANLSADSDDNLRWSEADAKAWLLDSGFRRETDGWVCAESSLKMLNRQEYAYVGQTGRIAA